MVGAAQLYVLTLYFQDALGRTPLEAGLLFIPMTLASVVASPVAGRLTTRLGTRQTAAWGFAMSGGGLVLVAWLMPHEGALPAVLLGMAVAESGFVTASVPLTVAATDGVEDGERGLASGVYGWGGDCCCHCDIGRRRPPRGSPLGALVCHSLRRAGPRARGRVHASQVARNKEVLG
jgi:MFS family permease